MQDEKPARALVIVSSTRASKGIYTDKSGPILVQWLREKGFDTPQATIVADANMPAFFADLVAAGNLPAVILTSGGTGLNSDDQTVEAVQPYLDKEIPGIMHAFWTLGLTNTPAAVLSRGIAGVIGSTFVMTLPGSVGAVTDGIATLDRLLLHIVRQLQDYHDH